MAQLKNITKSFDTAKISSFDENNEKLVTIKEISDDGTYSKPYSDGHVETVDDNPPTKTESQNYSTVDIIESSADLRFQSRIVLPTFNHRNTDESAMVSIQRLINPCYSMRPIDIPPRIQAEVTDSFNYSKQKKNEGLQPLPDALEKFIPTAPTSVIQLCNTQSHKAGQKPLLNSCIVFSSSKSPICIDTSVSLPLNDSPQKSSSSFLTLSPKDVKNTTANSVEKRNARERTRVHTVNQAFNLLKNHLPSIKTNTKRVSKLKILKAAVSYICSLDRLLKSAAENRSYSDVSKFESKEAEKIHSIQRLKADEVERHNGTSADIGVANTHQIPLNILNAESALFQHFGTSGLIFTPNSSFVPIVSSPGTSGIHAPLISTAGLLAFNEHASLFGSSTQQHDPNTAPSSLSAVTTQLPIEIFAQPSISPFTNIARMSQSGYY